MPIPDEVVAGDSGHIQDHNDIAGVLTEHESAISTKANVNSPTFTGTPSAPTAAVDTNTTQIATTAFVVGQGYAKSSDLASIYLPLSGGTLTGTISGTDGSFSGTVSAADPTLDSHLTTKFYVDDAISTVSGGSFQNLTFGDFLTGTSSTYNGLTAVTVDVDGDSLNTPSTLVARDVSGNFSAGVITGSLSGNASTASALETSRTISLGGQLSGSASFDGSANITITGSVSGVDNTDLVNDSVTVTAGTGLSGGGIVSLGSSISIDNDGILSVSGTTNEITASTVSGAVTLGLPSDITVSGNITAADPTLDTHLATKSYVDANAGGVAAGQYATATIRAVWNPGFSVPPLSDGATGTVMTVTLPTGTFTQAPVVFCQEMYITVGEVTGSTYFDVMPYTVSSSSIGLWVQNIGPSVSVVGGTNISVGVVDIWAVQMAEGGSFS